MEVISQPREQRLYRTKVSEQYGGPHVCCTSSFWDISCLSSGLLGACRLQRLSFKFVLKIDIGFGMILSHRQTE